MRKTARAVAEIAHATHHLLEALVTSAPVVPVTLLWRHPDGRTG